MLGEVSPLAPPAISTVTRSLRTIGQVSLILGTVLLASARAESTLDTIRSDVRTPPPPNSSPPPPAEKPSPRCDDGYNDDNGELDGSLFLGGLALGSAVVTSPYWVPRVMMNDDSSEVCFPRFPYDDTRGYLVSEAWLSGFTARKVLAAATHDATGSPLAPPSGSPDGSGVDPAQLSDDSLVTLSLDPSVRRWGAHVRADYADEFADLTGVGGQFILETTSRWGFDASYQYLGERLPGGGFDHLSLGDGNVVYRFAQSPRAQMRMGIGVNWLDDATRTDCGFNFTYGGDFFPRKPWVVSAAIDWGTLGHAGLFRFRTTVGVVVNRFETYVGYEYLDIGSTQGNFLIGGVGVWF